MSCRSNSATAANRWNTSRPAWSCRSTRSAIADARRVGRTTRRVPQDVTGSVPVDPDATRSRRRRPRPLRAPARAPAGLRLPDARSTTARFSLTPAAHSAVICGAWSCSTVDTRGYPHTTVGPHPHLLESRPRRGFRAACSVTGVFGPHWPGARRRDSTSRATVRNRSILVSRYSLADLHNRA